ncbi:50S ribosomal protein L11 methyltransferase [Mastigocoleus testarum]|uniref:50S ribosomal protein L11 methyltransferase n=1 Tax=Mastigocoleus testarum BC008 TaxID=371196 RepID=A0A0V7ZWH6_9CYAN|nr:50S ribosomal protein L11 methyltransferase [Mastigocoleus testarum]KST68965.1 50S ribosomal protein L11 methyltransferase [Mastigocoleus testarum BC008]
MQWIELSVGTTEEAVDWVCTLLTQAKYSGDVRIAKYNGLNSKLNQPESEWAFKICLYLADDIHANTIIDKIDDLLSPLQRTGMSSNLQVAVVEEKPDSAAKVNHLHRIGKRFVILSPDNDYIPDTSEEIVIKLETSLAFGSGLHPATILSMKLLERHVLPEMNILDLGSGSGILSVAIAKLGANVLAIDNDQVAVQATQDAVDRNGVEKLVKVMEGSLGHGSTLGHWMGGDTIDKVRAIEAQHNFDLIVANIFARIHISLASDYQQALRQNSEHGGILIAAGFTSDYEEAITTTFSENGFTKIDCEKLDDWMAIAYRIIK